MQLSDTQRTILEAAASNRAQLAHPPARLGAGARQVVAKSMLKNNLVAAIDSLVDGDANWNVDGNRVLLKITDEGRRAIGIDPNVEDEQGPAAIARRQAQRHAATTAQDAHTAPTAGDGATPAEVSPTPAQRAQDAPLAPAPEATPAQVARVAPFEPRTPVSRATLRFAAAAVLDAWHDQGNRETDIIAALEAPMAALRAALDGKPARAPRAPVAPRTPGARRDGTKQDAVLALLRRPEGATLSQIADATGWQHHTIRGFFAGLKKRQGIEVAMREKIRGVGPDGAKVSHSIYAAAAGA